MAQSNDKDRSSTLAKGLAVLECFNADNQGLNISDVAKLCGLDRAVARRLLLTFVDLGYLEQNERTFRMTPKVMAIAGGFLQSRQYGTLVQPILETYAKDLGTSVSLAVMDNKSALYVAKANADPTRITFGFTVGSRLPLYCTAIGRALLSLLPDARLETVLRDTNFHKITQHTQVAPGEILQEVETTRELGHAVTDGEFEIGVIGCAIPLQTQSNGQFAIGTSFVEDSIGYARINETIRQLSDCARTLGKVL